MNELVDNMDQIAVAFQGAADAAEQFVKACQRAWAAICNIVADAVRFIERTWRNWRALHLIPRQYRDTMARRKMRRYVLMYRN